MVPGTESLVEWQEHMVLMLQVNAQVWLCSYSGGMTRDQERQGNTDKYAGMQALIGRSVAILFIVTRAKTVDYSFGDVSRGLTGTSKVYRPIVKAYYIEDMVDSAPLNVLDSSRYTFIQTDPGHTSHNNQLLQRFRGIYYQSAIQTLEDHKFHLIVQLKQSRYTKIVDQ